MSKYRVNGAIHLVVDVWMEADSAEEALEKAKQTAAACRLGDLSQSACEELGFGESVAPSILMEECPDFFEVEGKEGPDEDSFDHADYMSTEPKWLPNPNGN